jgi:hypothetical protein
MTKVIGPPRSKRRRWTFIWFLVVALGAGMLFIGAAQAVHDENVFELEGNAITNNSPPEPKNPVSITCNLTTNPACDDWDHVYAGTSAAEATGFVTDKFGAGDSIFQGGSTKDINDLPGNWQWKQTTTTSVQDKDDIEHAAVAQYRVDKSGSQCGSTGPTANCVLLYFGADRFSNSGDSVLGFWFFRKKVSLSSLDANGNGTFVGQHTAKTGTDPSQRGDILVVADFRAGGKVPGVRVFEWVNSGGSATTHLDQLAAADQAGCTQSPPEQNNKPPVPPVSTNDNFCATANQFLVHSPWAFTPKSNSGGVGGNGTLGTPLGTNPDPNTQFGVAEFMEGGINLTALGLGNECFSSFLAESRSSHTPDSTLSDFALGGFGSCSATLKTQSSNTTTYEVGGSAPTDTATISVGGAGGSPPAPTGNVSFFLCGPSTTQITSCDPTGKTAFDTKDLKNASKSGNDYSVTSTAPTITSAGYYCFTATWPGDTNYTDGPYGEKGANECFQVTPKQPTISTNVNTAGPVVPGTELYDTAHLGNLATPSNGKNGTITFTAYKASDANTCTNAVYTSVIGVTGSADYKSRDGDANNDGVPAEQNDLFKPTDPGNYNWIAAYTPDAGDVNNKSATTLCGDANEGSVVQQFQPTATTAQTWTVKDSITILDGGGGGALAGTAHFELHKTSDCSDSAVDSQDVPVSGATPQTVGTTVNANTTFTTSQPTLYWKVSYTSTNPAQKDIAASCKENSSVTITNS